MNTQQITAEAVRIEVDLIVGVPASGAGAEAQRTYLILAEQGIEHWHARELAILVAAGALLSRAQVAQFSDPAAADRYIQHALRLQRAIAKGEPMADAVGGIPHAVAS